MLGNGLLFFAARLLNKDFLNNVGGFYCSIDFLCCYVSMW